MASSLARFIVWLKFLDKPSEQSSSDRQANWGLAHTCDRGLSFHGEPWLCHGWRCRRTVLRHREPLHWQSCSVLPCAWKGHPLLEWASLCEWCFFCPLFPENKIRVASIFAPSATALASRLLRLRNPVRGFCGHKSTTCYSGSHRLALRSGLPVACRWVASLIQRYDFSLTWANNRGRNADEIGSLM